LKAAQKEKIFGGSAFIGSDAVNLGLADNV